MKRKLLVLVLFCFVAGCASAFHLERGKDGELIKETRISYPIWGARQTKKLEIDLKEGKISLGSIDRNAGALGETLKNTSETLLNISKVGVRAAGLPQ